MTLDVTIRVGSYKPNPNTELGRILARIAYRETCTRPCPVDGCENTAPYGVGYYLVGTRRVRVWACEDHRTGNPLTKLDPPAWVVEMERAEAEHLERMRKRYTQNVDPDKGVSVKTLAPAGHGDPIRGDRVAQWRWGGW